MSGSCGVLLDQHKIRIGPHLMNGAGLHVAAYAQALGISIVAHLIQLVDGDVIALALLDAGVSEIPKRDHNDGDSDAKAGEFAVLRSHTAK